MKTIKKELLSQYRAALNMLIDTINRCPDDLWEDSHYENAYWRIAYHALHYTALYAAESQDTFVPWVKHHAGYHVLGSATSNQISEEGAGSYSRSDLRDYACSISQLLEQQLNTQNLAAPSGFEWLRMNKFALHLYNIRHLQHHIGQLVERLHQYGISGINWVDAG